MEGFTDLLIEVSRWVVTGILLAVCLYLLIGGFSMLGRSLFTAIADFVTGKRQKLDLKRIVLIALESIFLWPRVYKRGLQHLKSNFQPKGG
jgi:hypothetical protein